MAKTMTPKQCETLYAKARMAGLEAGNGAAVTPMVVSQHANMLDDASPVVKNYFVPDGVCGFAWVTIRPANCAFAKFLKARDLGGNGYYGGFQYSVRDFGQSMQRKEAYAYAFAKVLEEAGVKASANSRID